MSETYQQIEGKKEDHSIGQISEDYFRITSFLASQIRYFDRSRDRSPKWNMAFNPPTRHAGIVSFITTDPVQKSFDQHAGIVSFINNRSGIRCRIRII